MKLLNKLFLFRLSTWDILILIKLFPSNVFVALSKFISNPILNGNKKVTDLLYNKKLPSIWMQFFIILVWLSATFNSELNHFKSLTKLANHLLIITFIWWQFQIQLINLLLFFWNKFQFPSTLHNNYLRF